MAGDNIQKITDLRFGQMNNLTEGATQPTFDPSRVRITDATRNNGQNYYSADLLEGRERWNGIVIRYTAQSQPWVASNFQRTLKSYERVSEDQKYYTYKIFIAELDSFKQLPKKFTGSKSDQHLINICRDAIVPLGENYGPIDYGTPVQVVFEDQENMKVPIIVEVQWNRRIPLQGEKASSSFFKHAAHPRGTVPDNDNLKDPPSPVIEGCSNYFKPSEKGADKSRVLGLGASFVRGDQTWAGVKNLDLDRVTMGGKFLNGGRPPSKSILAQFKANVDSGCVKPENYDSVIIFGGANGMGSNPIDALKALLEYTKEIGIENRYVITLHGWTQPDSEAGKPLAVGIKKKWSMEKRKRLMTATKEYNQWMRDNTVAAAGSSALITDVLDWEIHSTVKEGSDDIKSVGEIVPGSQDWLIDRWGQSDGLHPNSAGHREIAGLLRTDINIIGL